MVTCVLDQRRILVVEDEYHVALDLCEKLAFNGAVVIGPAPRLSRALELISETRTIDAALLDINLGGTAVYPAAEALLARSVPFIFMSGYDQNDYADRYALMPRCPKPTAFATILRELTELL